MILCLLPPSCLAAEDSSPDSNEEKKSVIPENGSNPENGGSSPEGQPSSVNSEASSYSSVLSVQGRSGGGPDEDDDDGGGEGGDFHYQQSEYEYEDREYGVDVDDGSVGPVYYYDGGDGDEAPDYEERAYDGEGEYAAYGDYPEAQERSATIVDEEGRAPQFQQLRAEAPAPAPTLPRPPPSSAASEKARIVAAMAPVPKDDPALSAVFPGLNL